MAVEKKRETLKPTRAPKKGEVIVEVVEQPISEGGQFYEEGDQFITTEDRAVKELGPTLVTVVPTSKAAKPE